METLNHSAGLNATERGHGIEQRFDGIAAHYENHRLGAWYQAQGEAVLKSLDIGPSARILDIGCGTGWMLRQVAESYPDAMGIGVDISGRMVEAAQNKAKNQLYKNLTFTKLDWENSDIYKDAIIQRNYFTHVICTSSFHYFENPLSAMQRAIEVLRPGGQVLLMDRAKDGSLMTALWGLLHAVVIKDHVKFYRSDELIGFLRDAGFSDALVTWRKNRLFWHKKIYTSLVLITAQKKRLPST